MFHSSPYRSALIWAVEWRTRALRALNRPHTWLTDAVNTDCNTISRLTFRTVKQTIGLLRREIEAETPSEYMINQYLNILEDSIRVLNGVVAKERNE